MYRNICLNMCGLCGVTVVCVMGVFVLCCIVSFMLSFLVLCPRPLPCSIVLNSGACLFRHVVETLFCAEPGMEHCSVQDWQSVHVGRRFLHLGIPPLGTMFLWVGGGVPHARNTVPTTRIPRGRNSVPSHCFLRVTAESS